MTSGRSVLAKSSKMTRCFEWTPRREKFSQKSFRASSSRNRIEEGVGLKDEVEAVERKGFWDRADLRFGAIDITNANEKRERGRKRRSEKLQIVQIYRPNVEGRPTFLHKERERGREREREHLKLHTNNTRTIHHLRGALQWGPVSAWAIATVGGRTKARRR